MGSQNKCFIQPDGPSAPLRVELVLEYMFTFQCRTLLFFFYMEHIFSLNLSRLHRDFLSIFFIFISITACTISVKHEIFLGIIK